MKAKDVVKNGIRKFGVGVALAVGCLLWLGASARPFGTNPFAGGTEGDGFNITVVDTDIDAAYEIVNADSAANYTYTPISTDTTLMIRYRGSAGDTALVHISGIRPKRGGNGGTMKDSLSYYEKLYKVNGGDSTSTDSVLHMFEQAWVDSGEASLVLVWAKGNSQSGTPLAKIPGRQITSPIAHVLFGSHDTPQLDQVTYTTSSASTITYELRQYPNIENALQYANDYVVRDRATVDANTRSITHTFPDGMRLPERCYIAVMALGGAADQTGSVQLIGKRHARH